MTNPSAPASSATAPTTAPTKTFVESVAANDSLNILNGKAKEMEMSFVLDMGSIRNHVQEKLGKTEVSKPSVGLRSRL
jgi:hypothetical protein